MASIIFHSVDFGYDASRADVFHELSLLIDSGWRCAVVGRNGQGKTTLLKLAGGLLTPTAGHVENPLVIRYFPGAVPPSLARRSQTTLEVVRESIAPFTAWEREMERCLAEGSETALARYGALHERYLARGGYEVDGRIARECAAMEFDPALLARPFHSLSGGEQTRALVAALFVEPEVYPLIDEPTNHLDMAGRDRLMAYLAGKRGFLLVSHDRRFLDGAVDHVLSINRRDVRLNQGNFSQWRARMEEELEAERRTRQKIERDVARLTAAAQATRRNAQSREGDKYRTGAFDKGFIGHRAAKQMKRARSVERRIDAQLEAKRGLLGNREKVRELAVETAAEGHGDLLVAQNLTVSRAGLVLFRELSFAVEPGDRVAIVGKNGCGKTTLLDVLAGERSADAGTVRRPGHVSLARSYQRPMWRHGLLRGHLEEHGLDETRFRQLMGVLGVQAEVFDRDLASFSLGEQKKVDLARSLIRPADVLLWDEPLNYIDLHAREQIERSVLERCPTLVFVEHDRAFVERVATRVLCLDEEPG